MIISHLAPLPYWPGLFRFLSFFTWSCLWVDGWNWRRARRPRGATVGAGWFGTEYPTNKAGQAAAVEAAHLA